MSSKAYEDTPGEASVEELKNLLIGPEKKQILAILTRLNNPMLRAKEISSLLPEALSLSLLNDNKISRIVSPLIDETIKISVKNNPKVMADAIFPALGPGIRKAITSTIMGMIQSLNHLLNHSFSLQGLKWRFEALRTGREFAEIVLFHTLVYKVEQIFLIHRETGIVLNHVVAEDTIIKDPDLVSGMLTAIQDFVNDSFSSTTEDEIETLRMGSERSVWIEKGEHAFIAAVIRGTPPLELRARYSELIEEIHLKSGMLLEEFDGDPLPFTIFSEQLKDGLKSQIKARKRKISPITWLIPAIIIFLMGFLVFTYYQDRMTWNNYLSTLKAQKGLIVLSTQKKGDQYHIFGLKDPLEKDPLGLISIENKERIKAVGHWRPFYSLDPQFIMMRVRQVLAPPDSVNIQLEGSALIADGTANLDWIEYFKRTAPVIAGIDSVDVSRLESTEYLELLVQIDKIKTYKIYFKNNSSEIISGQEETLDQLVNSLRIIQELKGKLGSNLRLLILGHTDSSGTEILNLRLSKNRAQAIMDMVLAAGIRQDFLEVSGVGNKSPLIVENREEDRQFNRAVSFQILQ